MKTTTTIPRLPIRETVSAADIEPGDILDGQLVGIPRYDRVRDLGRSLSWIRRARQHLAIERGTAGARQSQVTLCRRIKALARQAAKRGAHLSVHAPSSLSGRGPNWDTSRGLHAIVWVTRDSRIEAEISIAASGSYTVTYEGAVQHLWRRADAVLRKALRRETKAAA